MSSSPNYLLHPRPRPVSRRGWAVIGIVAVVVAVLLSFVVTFYDAEGGSSTTGGLTSGADAGLIVTLDPHSIDARTDQATVHLSFGWQGDSVIDREGRLLSAARIIILSSLGVQEIKYDKGDTVGQFDTGMGIDGEEALYPFDTHTGFLSITAETYTLGKDGGITSSRAIPVGLQGEGGVNGWNTSMDLSPGMSPEASADFVFTRAFSTQVFALLLLTLSVIIALCALVVGVLIGTNRRRIEATILSWVAALLFALPLLRNYMPNAPPIGAGIDIYVYLWAIVMAVIALVLMVVAFVRQKRAELEAEAAARASAADASPR